MFKIVFSVLALAFGIEANAASSGCIGNRVWLDENKDGVQQSNELGIADIPVTLVDEAGLIVDSGKTQSKGYFNLCGTPGAATLQVTIPNGYNVTESSIGNSKNSDSNIDALGVASVVIVKNKRISHVDAGLISTYQYNESEDIPTNLPDDNETTVPETTVGNEQEVQLGEFRYGVWVEPRNAMPSTSDPGVKPAFPLFNFAHVRGKPLAAVGRNPDHPEYVVNILNAASLTGTALDLQLGSSNAYGWNYDTNRGNFSLNKWKAAISLFADDPAANEAIQAAIDNGTIRYIFLIDEPHHARWSPTWNGRSSTSGDINHISNSDLDEMAAHVKSHWGNNVKTIVRAAPVRLIQNRRGGKYLFNHLTHAYLSPSPTKWLPGNSGTGKGFEWWLRQKNNHVGALTNCNSFTETGLKMAVMLQWGFESRGNPYNGSIGWGNKWWAGDIQYPYQGKKSYVKASPLEMDFIIKHFLIPRNLETCEPDEGGKRLVDTIVSFRWDRLPTDNGRLPMSAYPHYQEFHERLLADISSGNNVPHIGIPVGIGAQ